MIPVKMNQVNQSAFELYQTYYHELTAALTENSSVMEFSDLPIKVYPALQTTRPKVFFLGINPSFSTSVFQNFQGEDWSKCSEWFSWRAMEQSGVDGYNYLRITHFDESVSAQTGKGEHRYFKAIRSFLKEVYGHEFDVQQDLFHFDLFQYRCTSQREFVKAVRRMKNAGPFIARSFELVKMAVDLVQPEMILVANAQVGKWLKEAHPEMAQRGLDKDWGCYHWEGRPVWLAAQLSGGVTDQFSRERLAWAIRRYVHEHP